MKEEPTSARRATGESARKRRRQSAPQAPDVRLSLQLLEAVVLSVMWHVRTTYWVRSQGAGRVDVYSIDVDMHQFC